MIGGFAAATYVLFDFTGLTPVNFDEVDFTIGNAMAGFDYDLVLSGNRLELVTTTVAIPEPSAYAALAALVTLGFVFVRRRFAA